MPLNATTKKYFAEIEQARSEHPPKPMTEMLIAEVRESYKALQEWAGDPIAIDFTDSVIPGPDDNEIPLRTYTPEGAGPFPVLVFIPGTAYMLDSFAAQYPFCSILAKYAGAKIIMPHYRLAPEYPFPHGLNDAYAAVKYVFQQAQEFNIDTTRFVVGGCSSGGNFAALIVNRARFDNELQIYHQFLISGSFDLSLQIFKNNPYLEYQQQDILVTEETRTYYINAYIPAGISAIDPQVSPYYEKDLTNIPPTTIIIPEYDGLRGENEAYAEKLKTFGNKVTKIIMPGWTHNFICMRHMLQEQEDPAEFIARKLREITQ